MYIAVKSITSSLSISHFFSVNPYRLIQLIKVMDQSVFCIYSVKKIPRLERFIYQISHGLTPRKIYTYMIITITIIILAYLMN